MRYYFLLIFALFSSCTRSSSPQKQMVRIGMTDDVSTLDPRKARDFESVALLHMLFEGLMRNAPSGEVEPAIAETMTLSEDGLTYTFSLKKTVWSNGAPLTANDFVRSFRSVLDPTFPSDTAYQMYGIKNALLAKKGEISLDQIGVHALDTYTLLITLEEPLPYFPKLLTGPPFFPTPETLQDTVSNGPFVLNQWEKSDHLRLLKNPNYWEASSVKLETIDIQILSADTALRLFEEGKLDWTGSPLGTLPVDAIASLKEQGDLQTNPFLATYFIRINTTDPLLSPHFRQTLGRGIDRNAITEHVLQGGQKPAKSLVPDMLYSKTSPAPKRIQNERVMLSYQNTEIDRKIAQVIQKEWEENLGLEVVLDAVEPKIFFQRVSQGKFQLAAGSWVADFDDPMSFLEVFKYKTGSTNNTGWENREYIDLLTNSQLCRDSKERREILSQAEEILMQEMPVIPIFHLSMNYLKKENLKGVFLSPLGHIDFRHAYWEETK